MPLQSQVVENNVSGNFIYLLSLAVDQPLPFLTIIVIGKQLLPNHITQSLQVSLKSKRLRQSTRMYAGMHSCTLITQ